MKKIAIVGCSFAGLFTGYYITKFCKDNVLLELFDNKKKIGDMQTSACATPTKIINELGLKKSILKNMNKFSATIGSNKYSFKVQQYSTFDYRLFCRGLESKINGKFRMGKEAKPRVIKSEFDLVIDTSGWMSSIDKNKKSAFAIETVISAEGPNPKALNFYLGKKFVDEGYCWAFPVKESRFRVGVSSYKKQKLLKELERFVKNGFKGNIGKIHGGYIPRGMAKKLTEDNIICVGDSAAHAYPITLEGIRPAFFFAKELSSLINEFSKDKISLEELKRRYEDINEKKRPLYNMSMWFEQIIERSIFLANTAGKILSNKYLGNKLLKTYFEFM